MSSRGMFQDSGSGSRRGEQEEIDLDITPMIDVTFLLLIFFMVASTMQATSESNIPDAKYGKGVETGKSTIVSIRMPPDPTGEPEVYLGESGNKRADVDAVTDYVRAGYNEGKDQVIIKADRDTPHGFVQRVARAANVVEGIRFFIAVRDKEGP